MNYRIFTHIAEMTATDYYRAVLPALHLKDDLAAHGIDLVASNRLDENDDYDAYMFGRVPDPATFMFATKMCRRGKKIIWDIDDDFLALPHWEPFKSMFSPVSLHYLEESLAMSHKVTTSTGPLATATLAGWPFVEKRDISVLENLIDVYSFFRTSGQADVVKVLWTGSKTHIGDMGPVEAILDYIQTTPNIVLIMFGYLPDKFVCKKNVVFVPWVPKWSYESLLSAIAPDIALLPLLDCPFNSCKSAIKFYETTMAGALCLASNVRPFSDVIEDQITGLLLPHSNVDQWVDEVRSYREHIDGAREMRDNARREVIECFAWNTDNPRRRAWRDFFVSLKD